MRPLDKEAQTAEERAAGAELEDRVRRALAHFKKEAPGDVPASAAYKEHAKLRKLLLEQRAAARKAANRSNKTALIPIPITAPDKPKSVVARFNAAAWQVATRVPLAAREFVMRVGIGTGAGLMAGAVYLGPVLVLLCCVSGQALDVAVRAELASAAFGAVMGTGVSIPAALSDARDVLLAEPAPKQPREAPKRIRASCLRLR